MPAVDGVSNSLAGKTIVVTRPAHQADNLANLITDNGGQVIRFPVLEITDPTQAINPAQLQSRLKSASLIIFISPNAADYGLKAIQSAGGIPESAKVAAIGQGTAKKLEQSNQKVDVFPSDKFDSEALLAMDELHQVAGLNVIIFRGVGGREHLADTLRQRGANVEYVECYQRVQPKLDTSELRARLGAESVDAIVVTSNEGLQNLYNMLDADVRPALLDVQLFVVSERNTQLAESLGFSKPAIIVDKASDQGIVDSLLKWGKE